MTEFVARALAGADLDAKRVCLVVPDGTRTCPLPLIMRACHDALAGRAKEVTVVIALGTHQGMTEDQLGRHLGYPRRRRRVDLSGLEPSATTSPGCRRPSSTSGRSARTGWPC